MRDVSAFENEFFYGTRKGESEKERDEEEAAASPSSRVSFESSVLSPSLSTLTVAQREGAALPATAVGGLLLDLGGRDGVDDLFFPELSRVEKKKEESARAKRKRRRGQTKVILVPRVRNRASSLLIDTLYASIECSLIGRGKHNCSLAHSSEGNARREKQLRR